tara:strand:- start:111 stop:221 length:111 start_codon:yes stop_codon:yes gene_type:complete
MINVIKIALSMIRKAINSAQGLGVEADSISADQPTK